MAKKKEKYLIHYDAATGDILERRPLSTDDQYADPMPEPYIEVNESLFMETLSGQMRVNPKTRNIEDIPVPEPTLDEIKTAKKAEIAAARYEWQRAGIEYGGKLIPTDDASRAAITEIYQATQADPAYMIGNFRLGPSDSIALTNAQIVELWHMVRNRMQHGIDRNAELDALIDAQETILDVQKISWSI